MSFAAARQAVIVLNRVLPSGEFASQRRLFFFILMQHPTFPAALDSIWGLACLTEHMSPKRTALQWLEQRLVDHHVTHLEKPIRKLAAAGLNAMEIAETLNDADYDTSANGKEPIGEVHVRAVLHRLSIPVRRVRWQ